MRAFKRMVVAGTVWGALACLVMGGCGGGGGTPPPANQVGTTGGTVSTDQGVEAGSKAVIPANALSTPVEITIQEGTAVATGGLIALGPAVEFGPDGTTFSEDVTVTIPFDAAKIPAGSTEADIVILWKKSTGSTKVLQPTNVDSTAGLVSVTVSSFSTFQAAIFSFFIFPLSTITPDSPGALDALGRDGPPRKITLTVKNAGDVHQDFTGIKAVWVDGSTSTGLTSFISKDGAATIDVTSSQPGDVEYTISIKFKPWETDYFPVGTITLTWDLPAESTVWGWGENKASTGPFEPPLLLYNGAGLFTSTPVRVGSSAYITFFEASGAATFVAYTGVFLGPCKVQHIGGTGSTIVGNLNLGDLTTECLLDASAGNTVAAALLDTGVTRTFSAGSSIGMVDLLDCGTYHAVVWTKDNQLLAWGENKSGQLGDGTTTDSLTPVTVKLTAAGPSNKVVALACGGLHTLVLLEDGTVWAWGAGTHGQLGDGKLQDSSTPVRVLVNPAGTDIPLTLASVTGSEISAGGRHSAVLDSSNNRLLMWGKNKNGELGLGDTTNRIVATPGGSLGGVSPLDVSCGGSAFSFAGTVLDPGFTVAVAVDGRVWSWGANDKGQLGDGTTAQKLVPTQLAEIYGARDVSEVSCGWSHTLVKLKK